MRHGNPNTQKKEWMNFKALSVEIIAIEGKCRISPPPLPRENLIGLCARHKSPRYSQCRVYATGQTLLYVYKAVADFSLSAGD